MKVIDDYLSLEEATALLQLIDEYSHHNHVPLIVREEHPRPLKYRVIDGEVIEKKLPAIEHLAAKVHSAAQSEIKDKIVLLSDKKVSVNINITPPGGAYRWHYDRNAVTAILYLNKVSGGEIEAYANYRVKSGKSGARQEAIDRFLRQKFVRTIFGRKQVIVPKPGRLVIMQGNRCLHSVRTVDGETDRVCVVISFDSAQAEFPQEESLNKYLYSNEESTRRDPNYVRTNFSAT